MRISFAVINIFITLLLSVISLVAVAGTLQAQEPTTKPLWSYQTGKSVLSISVSAGGSFIAAGAHDGKVYLLSRDGKLSWSYTTEGPVATVSISADGYYIAAGSNDGKVYLLTKWRELLWSYQTGGFVRRVSISADGSFIAAGSDDKKVYFFNRYNKLSWSHTTGGPVPTTSVSTDGSIIAAGSNDGKVYLFNKDGKMLWGYQTGGTVQGVSITADGLLIAAGSADKNIYLFNKDGKLLWNYQTGGTVLSVKMASDGSIIAAGSGDNKVYLLSKDGKLLWSNNIWGSAWDVSVSADANVVAAGSGDNKVYLFSKDGKLLWSYQTGDQVWCVSVTADSFLVAAGSWDNSVFLFTTSIQEAQQAIDSAQQSISVEKSKGFDMTGAEATLAQAQQSFSSRDYANAIKLAAEAEQQALDTGKIGAQAKDAVDSAHKTIIAEKIKGYDFTKAETTLEEARHAFDSGDYTRALSLAQDAKQQALDISKTAAQAKSAIESAEQTISTEKEKGLDMAKIEAILKQARQVYDSGDYAGALALAQNAKQQALGISQGYEQAGSAIDSAQRSISAEKSKGFDMTGAEAILAQAQQAFESGDYASALTLARQAQQQALDTGKSIAQAKSAIDSAKQAINTEKSKGFNLAKAEATLAQAQQAFELKEYDRVSTLAQEAKQQAVDTGNSGAQAKTALDSAKQAIATEKSKGFDLTQPEATLAQAQQAFDSGDYSRVLTPAQDARQQAIDTGKAGAQAKTALDSAKQAIATEKSKGFDLTQPEATLAQAQQAFASGDYAKAYTQAEQSKQQVQDAVKAQSSRAIETALQTISAEKSKGIDMTQAEATVTQAQQVFASGDYAKAVTLSQKAGQQAQDTGKSGAQAKNAIDGAKQTVTTEESKGFKMSQAQDTLMQAQQSFALGDYSKSLILAQQASQQALEVSKNASPAKNAIDSARQTIAAEEAKGFKVSQAQDMLTQAQQFFTSGDYSKALTLAQQAAQQAENIGKSGSQANSALESAQQLISAEGAKGINMTQATVILDTARQAFRLAEYTRAITLAQESTALAQDVDRDGTPNGSDFAPTIKNIYIYIAIAGFVIFLIVSTYGAVAYNARRRRLIPKMIQMEKAEIIAMIEIALKEK